MLQRQLCLILNRRLSAAMFALFMQVEYASNKLFFNLLITMMTKDHTLVTFEFPHDALLSNRFDLQHLFSPIQCQFLILQFCLKVKKSKLEYEVTTKPSLLPLVLNFMSGHQSAIFHCTLQFSNQG